MSQTEPPDGEAVGEPSSKSYVALQNDEWERRLVGRKFVENEDEGFQDLKVQPFFLWQNPIHSCRP